MARLPAPAAPPPVKRPVATPPVVIRQVLPPIPPDLARFGRVRVGNLEITIDETGKVEDAVFSEGIHPLYDTQVILATRTWRYQPATTNGVPTKFRNHQGHDDAAAVSGPPRAAGGGPGAARGHAGRPAGRSASSKNTRSRLRMCL